MSSNPHPPILGNAVIFVDSFGKERHALVTHVGQQTPDTWVNLLCIDVAGAVESYSSVPHYSTGERDKFFWK